MRKPAMNLTPGIHCDAKLLENIRQQINAIQGRLSPSYLNDIPAPFRNYHCDCRSIDSDHTDAGDPTWCPYQNDSRTYDVLGRILPNLKSSVSELMILIGLLEARAAISKEKHEQKVTTWLRTATLFDSALPAAELTLEQPIASTANSIQRLVPDVLAYIFHEAREDHPLTIIRLSQVNQTFRNVALHTPLLWAKIDILQDANITAFHLERSGDVPLDVSWSLPPMFPISDGATRLSAFMSLMRPHSPRIRSLNALQCYPQYSRLCIDFILSTNLPFLKMLEIGHSEDNEYYEPVSDLTAVPPALTSLSLHNIQKPAHGNAIYSHLTSSSITTFSLTNSGVWSLSSLLACMPNLRCLHIRWSTIAEVVPTPEPVLLAHLQELVMEGSGLLTGFRTPRLESMALMHYGYPRFPDDEDDNVPDWTHFSLEDALRDNPQLLRLRLENTFQTRSRWKEMFQLLPSLYHLRIASCNFPGDCLTEAISQPSPDGHVPCPLLRHLTIGDEQHILSDEICAALVARSNHKGIPTLETLTITQWLATLIQPDDLRTIRQCVDSLTLRLIMDYEAVEVSDGGVSGSDELDGTESCGSVEADAGERRIQTKEDDFRSEHGSEYSSSCSEGSWASGDEMIVQRQLPFEHGTE